MVSTSMGPEGEPLLRARADAGGFTALLRAVAARSLGRKVQVCGVVLSPDALCLQWEDDAHTLQSKVLLAKDLFESYRYEGLEARVLLGLNLTTLADTLGLLDEDGAVLHVTFPGPNRELSFEVNEADREVCTYASLPTLELPSQSDWADDWVPPGSTFMAPGLLLKEAVEDLEWAGSTVELYLRRDPPEVHFTGIGQGTLKIKVPFSKVTGFYCAAPKVVHHYALQNLRTAFANMPAGTTATKVSVDGNGMLKVMHMVELHRRAGHQAGKTFHGMADYDSQERSRSSGIVQVSAGGAARWTGGEGLTARANAKTPVHHDAAGGRRRKLTCGFRPRIIITTTSITVISITVHQHARTRRSATALGRPSSSSASSTAAPFLPPPLPHPRKRMRHARKRGPGSRTRG